MLEGLRPREMVDHIAVSKNIPLKKNANGIDRLKTPIIKLKKIAKTFLLNCMWME